MTAPTAEHQAFIEALVDNTPSIAARLLREDGMYSRAIDKLSFNELVERLSSADKDIFAQILDEERRRAIFDVLVLLHERCVNDGWRLSKEGVEIPSEPYGYTMFEEYVTLLDDDRGWGALK